MSYSKVETKVKRFYKESGEYGWIEAYFKVSNSPVYDDPNFCLLA